DRYASYLDRCERINEDSFGEPLSHPQLLETARRFATGGRRFSLVTNGLLLDREKAEALAELGPSLGIHVSFNAATARTFYWLTGKPFELLVDNVRTFIDVYRRQNNGSSPDLTVTFIVMRVNRDEVPAFLRLAREFGVHALLAPLHERPSKPLGHFGYDFLYEREMLPLEDLHIVGEEAQRLARYLGLTLLLQWEPGCDSAIRTFSEPGVEIPCLIPWRYLHIQQHSQKVYACPYHKRPIGDVSAQSIDEIWNGDTARELRRSLAARQIPKFCWNNSASCPLIYRARRDGLPDLLTGDITMGDNDYCHLAEGWHALEEIPDRVRWTSARADFRIAPSDKTTLCLRCQSFKPQLENEPARGHVELPGRRLGDILLSRPGWHELRFSLPTDWRRIAPVGNAVLDVSIVIDNPWVPAATLRSSICEPVIGMPRVVAGSYDTRQLGIVVQRIWMD
ncbi:MAG: hypothetical protein C5B57_01785, partial [Blastocatellia bacterium]